ncbi:PAS domain-containing protein [Olivibacter sitiensis]|uniref:PAS domain-containing protein n=1 Tax=Olivibacter sitiensis TaxID=376470 RepID=UPI00040D5B83|nr:PAS domain-containing protein [Olivibacter sitiensis]
MDIANKENHESMENEQTLSKVFPEGASENTRNRPTPIDKEVAWDKTKTIMSKTDQYGTIEYANDVFIDVCGYEDYELMGQPHNIIRHPDMPKVIFKVLWENLKEGNNFHAIVKNLAKSGRYYWVMTDFEVTRNTDGEITNYIGRRKAVPTEIIDKHIAPLYKRLLQIEQTTSVDASEKYLIGFLEEQGNTYVGFIQSILEEYEERHKPKVEKEPEVVNEPVKRGFFSRFFG